MSVIIVESPVSTGTTSPRVPQFISKTAISAKRIRFVSEAPPGSVDKAQPGSAVVASFAQPRSVVAVEEAVDWKNLPADNFAASDDFVVVFVPPSAIGEWRKTGRNFLRANDAKSRTITVNGNERKVEIQPGRAVVQCPAKDFDAVLAALVEFAFYHGELLSLEQALIADESHAHEDAPRAFRITRASRKHWKRWTATIERLAGLRLRFARLEPCLYMTSPSLPVEARRVLERLLDKADIEDRCTAFSDRLEACEDLYEGASDRVTDYRGWRQGHWLEIGIIALLLLEGVLMGTALYYQVLDYHHTIQVDSAEEK